MPAGKSCAGAADDFAPCWACAGARSTKTVAAMTARERRGEIIVDLCWLVLLGRNEAPARSQSGGGGDRNHFRTGGPLRSIDHRQLMSVPHAVKCLARVLL